MPGDGLPGLVTLPGDEHDVAGLRAGERVGDGGTPVELDPHVDAVPIGEAGEHGVGDGLRDPRDRGLSEVSDGDVGPGAPRPRPSTGASP